MEKWADELGDLLLHVYLHSEIARQEVDFAIGDVFEHVNAKLIRRHPHVFGETEVSGAEQVLVNWQEIKKQERIAAGKEVEKESGLGGVQLAGPAVMVAEEDEQSGAASGFEVDNVEDG